MKSKREIAVSRTAMTGRTAKGLAALLMSLALVFGFASCDTSTGGDDTLYRTVTYSTEHATAPEKLTVEDGTALTAEQLPTLTAEGYTFGGWYDGEIKAEAGYKVTKDVTLTAKWTKKAVTPTPDDGEDDGGDTGKTTTYTVTFSTDGAETKQTIAEGEKVSKPTDPTKTGYTFDGWYKDDTKFDFETTVTANLTLTAKWTLISYTITYVLPDGVTNPNVTSYTIETDTITLQAVSREGYIFNGWFDAETGGNKVESIVQGSTGAKTLYAQWWTFSLQVSGSPSKTFYYVGDSLDSTGLTVTAIYSDGSSKTLSGFYTESVNLGSKLTISYTEGGLTKTADVSGTFYVAASGAKPTESPVALTDYTGTLAGGTYYAFGDFPQTIAAGTVTFSDVPVYNGYYLGSDGYFYAKCTENGFPHYDIYSDGRRVPLKYTYSDGTTVAWASDNSTKYFKVEPIKWRVLNPSASGNKILVAESILTANVDYYDYHDVNRTIDGKTVYPSNYEHSKIRAYLNGLSYVVKANASAEQTTDSTYNGIGFLQTAFTQSAQNFIATTTVDNSAASTNTASNAKQWNNGINDFACENTEDKIFLLSEKEATTADYGFREYDVYESSRIRQPTDFAKANYAYAFQSNRVNYGGWWWLRSPGTGFNYIAHIVFYDGIGNGVYNVNEEGSSVVPALCLSLLE